MSGVIISNFKTIRLLLRDAWITALVISFIALAIHRTLDPRALVLICGIALGYILAYTLNDYFDADEDSLSKYKSNHNFFVIHKIPPKLALIIVTSILIIMLLIFASFGMRGIGVFFISVVVLWAYSSGPFRLRNIPLFDVVVHSLFIISYPYFVIIYLLDLEWITTDYLLLTIFIIGSAIIQLENQIRDYDLDKINGNNTTITIGLNNSNNLIKLLTLLLVVISIYGFVTIDSLFIFLPFALIYSPIIYQRLVLPTNQVRTEKQIRIVIGLTILYSIFLLIIFAVQ